MEKILLASSNKGKLKEFQSLFSEYADNPVELILPASINLHLEIEENGKTYADNAARKVTAYGQISKMITIADDSGLEVDALDGEPGLHSARFMGMDSDKSRRDALLEALKDKPKPWTARFRCVVAILKPGEVIQFTEGICPGQIITEERGENGFGYDPIFVPDHRIGKGRTMAELNLAEKNLISHRALAVKSAFLVLAALLGKG